MFKLKKEHVSESDLQFYSFKFEDEFTYFEDRRSFFLKTDLSVTGY